MRKKDAKQPQIQLYRNLSDSNRNSKRWTIAVMGTTLQLCLGTVYAWSFFQKPIMAAYGWSNSQVAWIFSLAICFLGIAAAWGGVNLAKFGPKKLAISGAVLYGLSHLGATAAMLTGSLPLFYISYGVIGGIGLGLGYVTPVATCAKWFPDKKGLVTGMVVMGFGLGALLQSKVIAPLFMKMFEGNLPYVFLNIGLILLVVAGGSALFMQNPPKGYKVPGAPATATASTAASTSETSLSIKDCLLSRRFMLLWLVFFANITAGIMFIGFQSPMLQDLLRSAGTYANLSPEALVAELAVAGATLIAISSLFNGLGRFFWGGISDRIGRINTFRIILASQVLVFFSLAFVTSPLLFGALVCYILLCYGGGFGTAPSTVLTIFGSKLMPTVYGTLLTAWSAAGIMGPQIVAVVKDHAGGAGTIFVIGGVVLLSGLTLTFFLNDNPIEADLHPQKE